MNSTGLCLSPLWDLDLTWNTADPDFTNCFQKTVLTFLPCVIIAITVPFEISRKKCFKWSISWNLYNITILLSTLSIITLNVVNFTNKWLLYGRSDGYQVAEADVVSPFICSLASILALILKIYNQEKGIVSSGGLFTFWCVSAIFELIRFRSVLMHQLNVHNRNNNTDDDDDTLDVICTLATFPFVCVVFLLNFLPDKTSYTYGEDDVINAEDQKRLSSFPSRCIFFWVSQLIYKGYRENLTVDNIWDFNEEDTSEILYDKFTLHWKQEKNMEKSAPVSISKILVKMFWKRYTLLYVLRVNGDLVQFLSPVFLGAFIDFIENDGLTWKGILFAFCLALPNYVRMMCISQFTHVARYTGLKIRSTLTAAIYHKAIRLSNSARQNNSTGGLVNLVAVDSQKFIETLIYMPQFCNGPIVFIIALYQLWRILGPSCFAGLAVLLLMVPINVVSLNICRKLQRRTMKYSDGRLKLINEMLNGIKVLKLYAWEKPFAEQVQNSRSTEINALSKVAYISSLTTALWNCTSVLMTICSFSVLVLINDSNMLTPYVAFVSLSLFNIIRTPLITLPRAISAYIELNVSIARLTKFMNESELDVTNVNLKTSADNAILVRDASFTWGEQCDDKPVLKDITMNVVPGKLVAVVGKVGSGKSSLISAILGDMTKQNGVVERQGNIAFVPQQAWIQNDTVRDNILFYKKYRSSVYNKVIEACALKPDLESFIAGDMTEIGEKGINLSGGQKQRVSLARAIYNDADIYLLDDPLSAVDKYVEKHLFDEVIGPNGLLANKSRVLSTNSLTFLPQCDSIIVLEKGVISERGTYNELLANNGAFSVLVSQYVKEEDCSSIDDHRVVQDPFTSVHIKKDVSRIGLPPQGDVIESNANESVLRTKKPDLEKYIEKGTLIDKEKIETGEVRAGVYWSYLRQMGARTAFLCSFFCLTYIGFIVYVNTWLSIWTDDSMNPELMGNKALLKSRLTVYCILAASQILSIFCVLITLSRGTVNASKNLHNSMLNNILHSPMSFFDQTPVGRIMNRFSKDINTLDVAIVTRVKIFLIFSNNLIAVLLIIVSQVPTILVVLIPLTIFFFYIQKLFLSSSRQMKRMESVSASPIYNLFSESLSGSSSIRAYNVNDIIFEEFKKHIDSNQKAFYNGFLISGWLELLSGLIATIIVLNLSIFVVFYKSIIGPSSAGLAISFAFNLMQMILFTIEGSAYIETHIVAGERVLEYINLESEAAWENKRSTPNASWPDSGEIKFLDYKTRYRPELDLVLKGINCHIKPKEKIGICGRTGAGKSSITLALFRIIEASHGCITIDGVDISTLGLQVLRSRLTIIPQDPVLFTGDLRFNLDPFSNYSDSEVWRALQLAHLKNYVMSMKGGLNSLISEGGSNMSVGQRQLVCLARALLRRTKILLLDEATAAVDLETDELIQETIRKEFTDCTVITIAHRLNTIMNSSRIMVVANGVIVEFDSPAKLLEDHKSILYGMVKNSSSVQL